MSDKDKKIVKIVFQVFFCVVVSFAVTILTLSAYGVI